MLRATLLALLALPACHGLVVATAQPLRGNAASTPLPANVAAKAAEAMAPAAPAVKVASLTRVADFEKATANADRLTVVKFFAPWCRACKAMAPKYIRVAEDWPDLEFYEILFDDNKKLCKALGIKILPYMEIIAGGKGKVESFTCGPSKISLLVGKLEDAASEYCGMEDIDCTDISHLL